MYKSTVAYPYKGILYKKETEWITVTSNLIDEGHK